MMWSLGDIGTLHVGTREIVVNLGLSERGTLRVTRSFIDDCDGGNSLDA